MKELKNIAGKAAGIAAAVQTFAIGQYVHAQALSPNELFGGNNATANGFANLSGLSTGGAGGLTGTIASLIRTAMGFLGIIAVIITLYGGFLWMTAAGNDDKVKQARKVMMSGFIGLVIVVAAFTLATFVITQLTNSLK